MYCFCSFKENQKLGIFLKHSDYLYSNAKELNVAVNVQRLEITFLEKVILLLAYKNYKELDPMVGDRKCQTRVSMLLDIFQLNPYDENYCNFIKEKLNDAKSHLRLFISKLENKNVQLLKNMIREFHGKNISDIYKENNLNFEMTEDFLVICLCYFIVFDFNEIVEFSDNYLSNSKAKDLLLLAKKILLEISVHYEQSLAEQYGNDEDKKILKNIETNSFVKMTAFFPSFKVILNKIKAKKQSILIKKVVFCDCGGIGKIENHLYCGNGQKDLIEDSIDNKGIVAVIEGYQFNGSLSILKKIVNLPIDLYYLTADLFKSCTCSKSLDIPKIDNIEDVILASFVQHDQFTNKPDIDWKALDLENSELKKEFDRLNKIPGCSLDDMSVFRIIHIYASTVEQELEDQKQMLLKLGQK